VQYDYFCIICGSQSSVDEDSSLLVYCTKLIGKILLMFQISMLPLSKGKGVSVQVIKEHEKLEVSLHSLRPSLPEKARWLALCPGIFNHGGERPSAPTKDVPGCISKPVETFREKISLLLLL
jgi:hypothetical protein